MITVHIYVSTYTVCVYPGAGERYINCTLTLHRNAMGQPVVCRVVLDRILYDLMRSCMWCFIHMFKSVKMFLITKSILRLHVLRAAYFIFTRTCLQTSRISFLVDLGVQSSLCSFRSTVQVLPVMQSWLFVCP